MFNFKNMQAGFKQEVILSDAFLRDYEAKVKEHNKEKPTRFDYLSILQASFFLTVAKNSKQKRISYPNTIPATLFGGNYYTNNRQQKIAYTAKVYRSLVQLREFGYIQIESLIAGPEGKKRVIILNKSFLEFLK